MPRIASKFDDLTLGILRQAFDDTCRSLPSLSLDMRDVVAKRMIGTAALGERDPIEIRKDAVAYVSD